VLVGDELPWRTRWSLLATSLRRRFRPAPVYWLRLGKGSAPISHADYGVDWETMRTIVVDHAYARDYRDAVVVDVGAHKGCFGAFVLEQGARAVDSYEPEQVNFDLLAECAASYRARGRDWWVHRTAVGGVTGSADLHVMGASWGHALAPSDRASDDELGLQRVPVVAMEDVLAEVVRMADGRALVVKVNAEGAECSIVLETPLSAWERVAELMVEVHSWAPCTLDELSEYLAGAGLGPGPPGPVDWVARLSRSGGSPPVGEAR
jgi:FkbM family methyltransferase